MYGFISGKYYFDRPWDIQKAMSESVATETTEPAVDTTEGRARSLNLNLDGVRHVVYFLLDSSASIGSRNFNTSISLAKAITKKVGWQRVSDYSRWYHKGFLNEHSAFYA